MSSRASARLELLTRQLTQGGSGGGTFDTRSLQLLLEHDNHGTRDALRELMDSDLFVQRYNISLEEERRLAFQRLKCICESGLVSIRDFRSNAWNIFAAHEITAFAGINLAVAL